MSEITVVVADDHPVFRKGLVDVLRGAGGVRVVGEAGDGETALQLIERTRPQVALLDLDLPRRSGLDVAQAVREQALPVHIAFLTMHAEGDLLRRALELGARAYLLKESAASDVLACLELVAVGRSYVSPSLSEHLVPRGAATRRAATGLEGLSPAERRVLGLIAQGLSSKEIAGRLEITPKTVENHRSHICTKLGLRGTNALLRFALEHRSQIP
jgi:DNA-binding NarL/FixJ family response regulator